MAAAHNALNTLDLMKGVPNGESSVEIVFQNNNKMRKNINRQALD